MVGRRHNAPLETSKPTQDSAPPQSTPDAAATTRITPRSRCCKGECEKGAAAQRKARRFGTYRREANPHSTCWTSGRARVQGQTAFKYMKRKAGGQSPHPEVLDEGIHQRARRWQQESCHNPCAPCASYRCSNHTRCMWNRMAGWMMRKGPEKCRLRPEASSFSEVGIHSKLSSAHSRGSST